MPRLSAVIRDRAEIEIPLEEGEVLTIAYRPSRVSTDLTETMTELRRAYAKHQAGTLEPEETERLAEQMRARQVYGPLCELLISWDLTDEDDVTYPITEDGIRRVPLSVLGFILGQIMGDNRPNLKTSPRSSEGSSEPSTSATSSQTGTS